MTVRTSVIVNQAVTINAESSLSINGVRLQSLAILLPCVSSMAVNGVLKWTPESDTSETWTSIPDTTESWSPIPENSETWQIAA
jgi:hypothetical protein